MLSNQMWNALKNQAKTKYQKLVGKEIVVDNQQLKVVGYTLIGQLLCLDKSNELHRIWADTINNYN